MLKGIVIISNILSQIYLHILIRKGYNYQNHYYIFIKYQNDSNQILQSFEKVVPQNSVEIFSKNKILCNDIIIIKMLFIIKSIIRIRNFSKNIITTNSTRITIFCPIITLIVAFMAFFGLSEQLHTKMTNLSSVGNESNGKSPQNNKPEDKKVLFCHNKKTTRQNSPHSLHCRHAV